MLLSGFSSVVFLLLSFLAARAHSSPINNVNITTDINPSTPGFTWAIPSTTTMIALYREEHGLRLEPSPLLLFMLLARFALQRKAQDAGGQHLPLTADFQYEAQGFTIAARQAGPTVASRGTLLYIDVENMFTAIEQQLWKLGYGESNIEIRRYSPGKTIGLGFGMIGKSSKSLVGDQSISANQTVTAIEKLLSIEVAPPILVNDTLIDLNNGVNTGGDGSSMNSPLDVTS